MIYRDSILVKQPPLRLGDPLPGSVEAVTCPKQGPAALRRVIEKLVISSLGRRPTCLPPVAVRLTTSRAVPGGLVTVDRYRGGATAATISSSVIVTSGSILHR
jgi:hypothetical protein